MLCTKESKQSLIAIKLSLPQTSGSRTDEALESRRRPLLPPHAEREADGDMSPSVRMIIELNIKHYREILKTGDAGQSFCADTRVHWANASPQSSAQPGARPPLKTANPSR